MYWADEIVDDFLKKKRDDQILITDWKTPSGHIHVGALRGIVIHDVIRHALADKGKSVVFQYGFDDYDPMDGLPVYIDQSYEKYMGMLLSVIPAPDGKSANYADQYTDEFIKVIEGLGYKPKFIKTSKLYKSGAFDNQIRVILDYGDEIRKIYLEVSGSDKGKDWYPLHIVCPKCQKVGTTKVYGWDGKEVTFCCEENLVKWAKGCGYEGKISPFKGNGKLPWKVEWPSCWDIYNSDIEGEGKDHSTAGGSRDIANHIFKEIFKKSPPYDIPYEWMLVGGSKMSTSKGVGVVAKDIFEFLPVNILRFLFTRTKPKRTIDFNPEGDSILNLYDDYDRASGAYFTDPDQDIARAFYFAKLDDKKELPKYLLRFSKIAYMLQMPRADIFAYGEQEKGSKLTESETQEIKKRIEIAKIWLDKYAPEEMKFEVKDKLPESASDLSPKQKQFLSNVLKKLEKLEKWDGQLIHSALHEVKNEMDISPKEAFVALYRIFIDKDSGPQAGWFLGTLKKDFVMKRLKGGANAN